MTKIQLNKDTKAFIENNSSMIVDDQDRYYYIPFWFKVEGDADIAEAFNFDNIPPRLASLIKTFRDGKEKTKPEGT